MQCSSRTVQLSRRWFRSAKVQSLRCKVEVVGFVVQVLASRVHGSISGFAAYVLRFMIHGVRIKIWGVVRMGDLFTSKFIRVTTHSLGLEAQGLGITNFVQGQVCKIIKMKFRV